MLISGRYELLHRIGAGGMAAVWEARDTVLGRPVAVKVVDLAVADDPALGERLHREAVAAASITHPDVVTVHDAGVADGVAYVVMTLVEGRDLAAVLAERGPLPVPEAMRLGTRLAGALAAVHAAGVVHRDVKPANVLLHGEDVTLVDFGIASIDTAQASLTAAGTVIGTAHGMSPEQARGEPATPASDVYGLGCLLTAALTGAPPFEAESAVAVLQRHLEDSPPSVRERRREVPAELDALVTAMLAKDPTARPTAGDVQDALGRLTAGPDGAATRVLPPAAGGMPAAGGPEPTRVLPAGPVPPRPGGRGPATGVAPGRGTPPPRRRGTWAFPVGLGALAVVLVGVLAFALTGGEPGTDDPAGTTDPGQAESPDPGTEAEPPPPAEAEPEAPPRDPAPEEPPPDVETVLAGLDDKDREELQDRWEDVVDALEEDKGGKAGSELRKLLRDVDGLERDGDISPEEADVLRAAFGEGAPGADPGD